MGPRAQGIHGAQGPHGPRGPMGPWPWAPGPGPMPLAPGPGPMAPWPLCGLDTKPCLVSTQETPASRPRIPASRPESLPPGQNPGPLGPHRAQRPPVLPKMPPPIAMGAPGPHRAHKRPPLGALGPHRAHGALGPHGAHGALWAPWGPTWTHSVGPYWALGPARSAREQKQIHFCRESCKDCHRTSITPTSPHCYHVPCCLPRGPGPNRSPRSGST